MPKTNSAKELLVVMCTTYGQPMGTSPLPIGSQVFSSKISAFKLKFPNFPSSNGLSSLGLLPGSYFTPTNKIWPKFVIQSSHLLIRSAFSFLLLF